MVFATFEATKKWTMPIKKWGKVYGELAIMYEGRLPEEYQKQLQGRMADSAIRHPNNADPITEDCYLQKKFHTAQSAIFLL